MKNKEEQKEFDTGDAMSHVTVVTKYKGKVKKNEVHLSQLLLDVKKRLKQELRWTRKWAKENPDLYRTDVERLEKNLLNPRTYNSGIVQARISNDMMTVTPQNKIKFVQELTPVDDPYPRWSDTGQKPLAYVDFDTNTMWVAEKINTFADYKYTLPPGWTYKKATWQTLEKRYKEKR